TMEDKLIIAVLRRLKKWKSLRDTYLKERRKETEKMSGSAAGSGKKWKYSVVLSFLNPFISPRETSGNMERGDKENQATGYEHPEDQGETEDELFLLSLVPSLQRLPPQTKEFVKFQIHKLIYESSTVLLNLEQLEPQD
uniref:BESS domain-containing protein n=1 Tax=Cyprinus carpio TaxID=7962 RepID=A0A8C1L5M1_CYPCA